MMKVSKKKHRVHSLTGRIDLRRLYKAFKAVKRNRGASNSQCVAKIWKVESYDEGRKRD